MSVYTAVGRDELAAWLAPFAVGELVDFAGIAAGLQNTNYFVTTADGEWVLTIFERLRTGELDFYLPLMAHLAARGVPCPNPRADGSGRLWRPLAGKPAALVSRLPGAMVETPGLDHCRAVGAALAALHAAAAGVPDAPPNPCGAAWRAATGGRLLPLVAPAEARLLADELAFQERQDYSHLPCGVIHGDLFRDNVLWREGRVSGVVDFYFAGTDSLLFDLAVAANDWCVGAAAVEALLAGYAAGRPLSAAEQAAWPALRRAAALRFWLLRLEIRHYPRPGEMVTVKDPDPFRRLLESLRLAPGQPHR